MRWGMAATLALVVIACGLYYGPLRDFMKQENAYQKELATLTSLQRQNKAIKDQIAAVGSDAWIAREARSQFQLVPKGSQAFVITNLPSDENEPEAQTPAKPTELTLGQRLSDLWQALLR